MKNQRPFTRDTRAVSEVISVIVMLVIVASVAGVALHVSMGLTSDSKIRRIPIVSMAQDDDVISIYSVQFGPIVVNDITIMIIDKTDNLVGSGTMQAKGDNLAVGDIIKIDGVVSGESYTVKMIYMASQVGETKYLAL